MVKYTTETCTEKQVTSIHISKFSHVEKNIQIRIILD